MRMNFAGEHYFLLMKFLKLISQKINFNHRQFFSFFRHLWPKVFPSRGHPAATPVIVSDKMRIRVHFGTSQLPQVFQQILTSFSFKYTTIQVGRDWIIETSISRKNILTLNSSPSRIFVEVRPTTIGVIFYMRCVIFTRVWAGDVYLFWLASFTCSCSWSFWTGSKVWTASERRDNSF